MLLIFDWDGTLSDSTARIISCVQSAAGDLAMPALSDDAVKDIIGLSLNQALATLYPGYAGKDIERLAQRYSEHFIAADTSPSAFYAGVETTLVQLKQAGFSLAVATGKSRKGLDRVLGNLGWEVFFDATKCADETASKPHPLMLQQLLDEFDVSVDHAVMVGDTEYDMAMAKAAAMARIAVSYGAHHIDRLTPYEPVLCLDDFSQLLSWQPLAQRVNTNLS